MITTDREQITGSLEQVSRTRFDLVNGFLDVEGVARYIAGVSDLLRSERRYFEAWMPWAQKP